MSQALEYKHVDALAGTLMEEIKKINAPKQQTTFAEPQNEFEMSLGGGMFNISGNGLIIALGVALSSMVTGFFSKFLPFGSGGIAKIIVGIILKKFVAKAGALKDFANGVLLAGISELAGGLTSGLGGMFGMPRTGYAGYNSNPGNVAFREPDMNGNCTSCEKPVRFGGKDVVW